MPDGLTVPFALAAGLSGAVRSTSIVITAGLALQTALVGGLAAAAAFAIARLIS